MLSNTLCCSLVFHIASMYFRRWSLVIHVFHLYIRPCSQIFYYPQKKMYIFTHLWIMLHICGSCFTTDTQYTHLRYFVPFFPLQLFEVVSCNHRGGGCNAQLFTHRNQHRRTHGMSFTQLRSHLCSCDACVLLTAWHAFYTFATPFTRLRDTTHLRRHFVQS